MRYGRLSPFRELANGVGFVVKDHIDQKISLIEKGRWYFRFLKMTLVQQWPKRRQETSDYNE